MKAGQWLNSLTGLDHAILGGFFIIACTLTWFTLQWVRQMYKRLHDENPYAHVFRITPFPFLGLAILYTAILYLLFGNLITGLFN